MWGIEEEVRTDVDSAESNVGILQVQPLVNSLGAVIPPAGARPPAAEEPLLTGSDLQKHNLVSCAGYDTRNHHPFKQLWQFGNRVHTAVDRGKTEMCLRVRTANIAHIY